jgi:hypothetical protein
MGAPMHEGHSTRINFDALDSGVELVLFEDEVTPPGLDGGESIEQTDMRNTVYETYAFRKLVKLSDSPFTAGFDGAAFGTLLSILNVNGQITITLPDAKTIIAWGALTQFTPQSMVKGQKPKASCVIKWSNLNGSDVETAPAGTAFA